ncbi:hypothetical protein J8F10_08455 [Gemmata sp. G18]|uniref:Cystatin domain-containing protein n=1 Tax=Gemmata palustris TaxID=2822762 RepID=A0ABS5BPT1_9BACT|nr:hypothetical protein [Gemmata palustris]MBP3955310.1 hypothetical protein [Gemmata palustris]
MRKYAILMATALGLTGCGGSQALPMAATPESSRAALVAALDGWAAGQTFQELSAASPPVQFIDDDLNRGTKLLSYKIEGEPRVNGTGYSYVVTLTMQDKSGASRAPKKVAYAVVTEPKHAVTREDRQP